MHAARRFVSKWIDRRPGNGPGEVVLNRLSEPGGTKSEKSDSDPSSAR